MYAKAVISSPLTIRSILIGFVLLFLGNATLFSQPFDCDGRGYLASVSLDDGSTTLYQSSTADIENSEWVPIEKYENQVISPIGFSVITNLIYGLDQTNWDLISIDKSGKQTILTSLIDKIDTTYEYHAGAISPSGRRFHIVKRDPETGNDLEMLNVRLDTDTYRIGILSMSSDLPISLGDMTYSPRFGTVLGFDENRNTVVDVNVNFGLVTDFNYQSTTKAETMGSLFFGRDGKMFGFGGTSGGSENTMFSVSPRNGVVNKLFSATSGDETDGCGCGYEIAFEKKISQPKVLPCSEQLITYYTNNVSGAIFPFVSLTDTLPLGVEIKEVERLHRVATLDTIEDKQIITFTIGDFLLGKDSTVLRVEVQEDALGVFESQGYIRGLPLGLDTLLTSDDPVSTPFRDPTRMEIVPLSVSLPDSTFICDGATAKFRVIPNVSDTTLAYIWSSGETVPSVSTDIPGEYSVIVTSTCKTAEASIKVSAKEEPLSVELTGDATIIQGETAEVVAESNFSAEQLAYAWKLSLDLPLDCENCEKINIIPLEDVEVEVLIEDPFGCKASDVLNILVDKTRDLLINNVFSPNADGINDYFFVKSAGVAMVKELHVVNSWGKTVYSETDIPVNSPSQGWDGKISGTAQPEGVYYWQAVIEYPDGSRDKKSGNLTLMR